MTTFATFTLVLLALCTPALADTAAPPPPAPTKIRFSVHQANTTRDFDVMVSSDDRCAVARHKAADEQIELQACASHDSHLTINWDVRSSAGEYHSTSSIPFEHGTTADLGSSAGPRLTVKID
jgi:hypothetical protein